MVHLGALLRTVLEVAVGAQGAGIEGALESAAATTATAAPRLHFVDTYGSYGGNLGNIRGTRRIESTPFLSSAQEAASPRIEPPQFFASTQEAAVPRTEPEPFFVSNHDTDSQPVHASKLIPAIIGVTKSAEDLGETNPPMLASTEITLRRENAELRKELQVLLNARGSAQPPIGLSDVDGEPIDDEKVRVKVSDDAWINLSHSEIMLVLGVPFCCMLLVLFVRMPVSAEQEAEEAEEQRRGARPREYAEKVMEGLRSWIGVFWPVAILAVFGIFELIILKASGAIDSFLAQILPIVAAGFFALAAIMALIFVVFEQVNQVQKDINEKVHMVEELFLGTASKVGDVGAQFKDATVQGVVRAKDGTIQGVQQVQQGSADVLRQAQEGSAETLRAVHAGVRDSPVGTAFKGTSDPGCVAS